MKDIMGTIGKILGLIFAALVIGFTAYLTYLLAARLVPGNTILQAMTVILFDGGALVWFILFLTQAKGTMQWAVAGIGFCVGLVGAVIMAGGELLLGQSLIVLEDTEAIGWILISTVVVAALAHATLTYAFHFTDPEVINNIENAQQVAKAIETAYTNARAEIAREAEEMGRDLGQSVVYEARAQLRAMALPHLRSGMETEQRIAEDGHGMIVPGTFRVEPVNTNAADTQTAPIITPAPAQPENPTPPQGGRV